MHVLPSLLCRKSNAAHLYTSIQFFFLAVERDILVNAEEYVKKLSDLNFIKIAAIAEVQETKQQYLEDCKIQLFHAECIAIKV